MINTVRPDIHNSHSQFSKERLQHETAATSITISRRFASFICGHFAKLNISGIQHKVMTVMAANENSHGSQQQPWIGTHDGKFHCDEVFACYMLKKLPRFSGHIILRTRDPSILAKCDIVVDVGAVYDHQRMRYDHHQRGFTETMNTITGIDYHTKLSSAGLIYAHYGKEVIAKIVGDAKANENSAHEKMYVTLYKTFIEAIDAIDNGIQQFDGIPRYQLSSTLTSRVESCNPAWNEKQSNPDEGFNRAKQIVGDEFEQHVRYMYNAWLPARQLVVTAIEIRKKVHSSGKILLFESGSAPWKQHFFELEKEMGLQEEDICLAVYQDQGGSWRVQAIPVSETSGFENRLSLPWKGFRDKDLEAESGITDAFFVHMSGFIGGAKTREGALKMAEEGLRHAGKWTETTA